MINIFFNMSIKNIERFENDMSGRFHRFFHCGVARFWVRSNYGCRRPDRYPAGNRASTLDAHNYIKLYQETLLGLVCSL